MSNDDRLWNHTQRRSLQRQDNDRMRATESIAGKITDEPYRSKDPRSAEEKRRAAKHIRETRRMVEPETARILRDKAIDRLAEERLRAAESKRAQYKVLE